LRGYALSAFENIALWHERDISHSSVERVILPDAFTLLEYMLKRLNDLIENLIIKKEQIEFNLNRSGGVYFSGHLLIQMVEKGLKRESAYKIIQACAHQALEQNKEFKSIVLKNNEVMKRFTIKEINEIMKTNNFLKNIDQIYKRVLG
jgi:adenylosuccinate lyase